MLSRVVEYTKAWAASPDIRSRALLELVHFFERRLGASFVFLNRREPVFADPFANKIVMSLKRLLVVGTCMRVRFRADEPRVYEWMATILSPDGKRVYGQANGSSLVSDDQALQSTLAEAVERYVWRYDTSYFEGRKLFSDRVGDFTNSSIVSFVGQSKEGESFECIKGYSWTKESDQYVPIQLVSGIEVNETERKLRDRITSGLATWESRKGAVLRGMLELVERDAYMNVWLNQLAVSLYDTEEIAKTSSELGALVMRCKRYRLTPFFLKLPTDFPTHAVCVVLCDETGCLPKKILGIKAGQSVSKVAEGALLEALRIRQAVRNDIDNQERLSVSGEVSHRNRLLYWTEEKKKEGLDFLVTGKVVPVARCEWEFDKDEEHLERILQWMRGQKFDCTSVSLTKSKYNCTPWHIEMVVVPQLQWMHLNEKFVQVNEGRRVGVPKLFGYTPLDKPFLAEPHPFA